MLNISIVYNSSVVQNIWILSQPIGYVKHEIEICCIWSERKRLKFVHVQKDDTPEESDKTLVAKVSGPNEKKGT